MILPKVIVCLDGTSWRISVVDVGIGFKDSIGVGVQKIVPGRGGIKAGHWFPALSTHGSRSGQHDSEIGVSVSIGEDIGVMVLAAVGLILCVGVGVELSIVPEIVLLVVEARTFPSFPIAATCVAAVKLRDDCFSVRIFICTVPTMFEP